MNELLGGGGDDDDAGDGDDYGDDCDRDGRVDKKGESLSPPQGGRLPGVKCPSRKRNTRNVPPPHSPFVSISWKTGEFTEKERVILASLSKPLNKKKSMMYLFLSFFCRVSAIGEVKGGYESPL